MADDLQFRIAAINEASATIADVSFKLRKLQEDVDGYNRRWGQAATAGYVKNLTQQIEQQAAQIVRLQSSIGNIDYKRIIEAGTGISGTFKSAEASASVFSSRLRGLGDDLEGSSSKIGQGLRHVVAEFDELMRGQRGAMIASATAFVRDTGLMAGAINALSSPWAAVAAAGVAAAVGIGYAFEQSFQRIKSIRETTGALSTLGMGSDASRSLATEEFDRLKASTDEYNGSIRALQEELNKLPRAAQGSREELAHLAESLAGLKHEEPAKAIEAFVKAAEHSPQALAELVEKTYGLQNALMANGQTLSEYVRHLTDTERAYKVVAQTAAGLQITKVGEDARRSSQDLVALGMGAAALGGELGTANPLAEEFSKALERSIDPLKSAKIESDGLTGAIRAQNAAIVAGNAGLKQRTQLLEELMNAQAGAERAGQRGADAVADLQAKAALSGLTAAEQEHSKTVIAGINATAQARHADLKAQATAADQLAQEARRVQELKFTDPQTGKVAPHTDTAEVINAENRAEEAHRRVEDQKTRVTIDNNKARIAEEQRGAAERVKLAQQNLDLEIKLNKAGRASDEEVERAREQLASQIRMSNAKGIGEAHKSYEAFVAEEKDKILQARGDYDKINEIIADWRTKAAAQYAANTTDFKRAMAEIDKAAIEANQRRNEMELQNASFMGRMRSDQLRGYEAQQQSAVKKREITQPKAYENDLEKLKDFTAEQKVAIDKAMELALATKDMASYVKLYEQAWALGIQYQIKSLEITEKLDATNRKMADAWSKPFIQAADKIGSAFEHALDGAVSGQKNIGQQFAKSIASALTGAIGSALSKGAASLVGGTGGQGLGEVIGQWISKGVGSLIPSAAGNVSQTATVTAAMTEMSTATTAAMTEMATAVTTAMTTITAVEETKAAIPFAAGGYDVPAFAGGGLSGGGLAILHPKEMVLPANLADTVRRASAGGGSSLSSTSNSASLNYSPTINAGGSGGRMSSSDFESMMRYHGDSMMETARRMMRDGWRPGGF